MIRRAVIERLPEPVFADLAAYAVSLPCALPATNESAWASKAAQKAILAHWRALLTGQPAYRPGVEPPDPGAENCCQSLLPSGYRSRLSARRIF